MKATTPTTTSNNLPAEVTKVGWGISEDLEVSDIEVPKIYHMQAISKLVRAGAARSGDFCHSITGEIIAKKDEGLDIIIFKLSKAMLVKKLDIMTNKFKLVQTIPITKENAVKMAQMPFSEERDGDKYSNSIQYNFFCLLPGRIDQLPYVISFSSTKAKVARKIGFITAELETAGRPGSSVVFHLKNIVETKGTDSWEGLEVSRSRDCTPEELQAAYNWYMKSKAQKFVAVEEELEDDQPNY